MAGGDEQENTCGIIRDMLINAPLPSALENPLYVVISIASAAVVITLALLTGTGGGILRDVFAVCFIIIGELSGNNTVALYSCFGITLIIRLACMKNDVHLKKVEKNEADL